MTPKTTGAGLVELFVDGRLVARAVPGPKFNMDTTKLSDGYHELRVVGVRANAVETQGRAVVPITVNNHDVPLEFTVTPNKTVPSLGTLKCSVRHPGATAIVIRQNSRELGRVTGEEGQIEIPAVKLGRGPVPLQAMSEGEKPAVSPPQWIIVQ